jgi:hypothetical protein
MRIRKSGLRQAAPQKITVLARHLMDTIIAECFIQKMNLLVENRILTALRRSGHSQKEDWQNSMIAIRILLCYTQATLNYYGLIA